MNKKIKIGIIGAGTMGQIICANLLKNKIVKEGAVFISDKNNQKIQNLKKTCKITVSKNNSNLIKKTDIIILAIKPRDLTSLSKEIKNSLEKNQIVVSIMAGISLKRLKKELGHKKIIRSMPNLAAKIGQAMTIWLPGAKISSREEKQIKSIFASFGKEIKVNQEKYLNLATAVSGSGPAYVFYFIEALIEAAKKLGFNEKQAKDIVNQTIIGAVGLYNISGEKAKNLRLKVTSKKGTTDAAIKSFEESKLKSIIHKGIKKALARALELEK
ncbi:pyrroline-5-carboxylate reductase [Candidatus Falkowbacteria bacterium]|nr:pyrroline-5-carboxylate reductase [Candidatus Falkowbacteria bacterium]